jgi:phosphatidylserine decarboxylase
MMIFQKDKVRLEDWAVNAENHQNDSIPKPLGSIIATTMVNED